MERLTTDILIAGGGIAGLCATVVLAQAGFDVICVDPVPPVTDGAAAGADLRSTAFLMPAVHLLERANIWPVLAPHAAALRIMRLVDAGGPDGTAREQVDFVSDEIGQPAFAYNLPNWLLRRELTAMIARLANAQLIAPASAGHMVTRSTGALVSLGAQQVAARLVIGADGRDSPLREQAGIAVKRWGLGQKAIVFTVTHREKHDNISTEVHRTGGPFTLVPLPDPHQSAVVWMDTGPSISDLMTLDADAFASAATQRSADVLGPLTLASRRAVWPIITQHAAQLFGPRLALLAEAAHVIPPIGAQGLNMSLADLETLHDLLVSARDAGRDIGAPELLATYNRARMPDIRARIVGVDLLNRAAMAQSQTMRNLRRSGLKLLHATAPLRRTAMAAGLGRNFHG